MTNKQLIPFLNYLGKEINMSFPNVNHGGCAVVAALVGQHLQQITKTAIDVSDDMSGNTIEQARKVIKNNTVSEWNDHQIWFGHVFVSFLIDGIEYFYDTNGVVKASSEDPSFHYPLIPGQLTVDEALGIAECDSGWNRMFPRSSIPKLKHLIDSEFSKFFGHQVVSTFVRQPG